MPDRSVLKQPEHPKNGMVMDFGTLKKLVQQAVIEDWDHALLLNENSPAALLKSLRDNHEKLVLLPYQPSCENMLLDIKCRLRASLPAAFRLCRLMLAETDNSYAEWYASDNENMPVSETQAITASVAELKTDRYRKRQG